MPMTKIPEYLAVIVCDYIGEDRDAFVEFLTEGYDYDETSAEDECDRLVTFLQAE